MGVRAERYRGDHTLGPHRPIAHRPDLTTRPQGARSMREPTVASAIALATAALLTVAPAVGAQSPADNTFEHTEGQAKSIGAKAKTELSDSWLTAKTKIALFADARVKGTQISVDSMHGVVHLRGKVDSEDAKTAAGEAGKGSEGVKMVANDLQVVPPSQRRIVDVTDEDITRQVEQRLAKNPQTKKVAVRTDAGVVTLTGEVPSTSTSAQASEFAREVPGVRSVKNQLIYAEARK